MKTELYTKFIKTVVICLVVSLSLSVIAVTGKGEDLGVLADLKPPEPKESPHAGPKPKDGVPLQFYPTQQMHRSPQLALQPSRATYQDVPTVDAEATGSDHVSQLVHSTSETSEREGSQKHPTDAEDSSLRILDSLPHQSNIAFENTTKTGIMVQSQSNQMSESFVESESMTNQHRNSNNDLSEPVQSPAETMSDSSLKAVDNPVLDSRGLQESEIENKHVKYNSSENEEDDESYGNPPILLDTNPWTWSNRKKVSFHLSSGESGVRQTETAESEKVDMTATDPSFTLSPMEQNFQVSASEIKSVSSSSTYATTITTSTTTERIQFLLQDKESSMLNIINKLVKLDSAEESQLNRDDNANKNSRDNVNNLNVVENKYTNRENHGRKVLNEENVKKDGKTHSEYEMNVDSYFYDSYDKEEDDYVGGEVLASVSSNTEAAELTMDESENEAKTEMEMTEDDVIDTDEQKEVQQPGDSGPTEDSGVFNVDHNFNYDAIDDDWYYDPDKKETAELIKTTPSSTVSTRDSSQQVKSANTNVSLPESKMETGGGGKLEGAVSKDEAPKKKVLQAPKRTIILYTAVILILIACIVLFSVWKKPFQDGRPMHQPTIVRSGEEGKRLLDHPFV